jgi:RNA polymerase sigma factor (sigma-70 family)
MIAITYSERELVHAVKSHDKIGFNYLYKNYANSLYGIIIRIVKNEDDANDILQEVFLKIWNNIDKYDAARSRFYTWMSNISRNAAIDYLRTTIARNKSKTTTLDKSLGEFGRYFEMSIDVIGVLELTNKLETKYKMLIDLAFYKGYTYEEIAEFTGFPLGTIKTRMRKAIQLLRKEFAHNTISIAT